MKTTKKIFSLFNLFLFVGSFCFTSLNAFAAKSPILNTSSSEKHFISKQDVDETTGAQSLFEKNENETENENFKQIPAHILSFFLSHIQFKISNQYHLSTKPSLTFSLEPIYLSDRNFRI